LLAFNEIVSYKEGIIRSLQIIKGLITNKKLALCDKGDFDGIASAALFKRKYRDGIVVLAAPSEVKTNLLLRIPKWYYVADLPCPGKAIIRVDHHKTNRPCAELEFYDPKAPAATLLALKALNLEEDPLANEIAKIAIETDTANVKSEESLLLDSAVKGSDYLGKLYLVEKLAELGIAVLKDENVKKWISKHTTKLKTTDDIVDNLINKIGIYKELIIIFEKDLNLDYRYMCISLERKGAHFTYILVPRSHFKLRIYAGANPKSNYDVTKVTIPLGGGGHRYAAGASLRGIFRRKLVLKAINEVKNYLNKDKIEVLTIDKGGNIEKITL